MPQHLHSDLNKWPSSAYVPSPIFAQAKRCSVSSTKKQTTMLTAKESVFMVKFPSAANIEDEMIQVCKEITHALKDGVVSKEVGL
ncbi:hypothetical protein TVAG_024670 [Trichomonas vaginalis G3]|uniref:Uncharacterized protein n=1 Tax=Trichomonas vaginalis (strain ATCC PRA-98 / G3) TaxID=412133 RepID=A2FF44_TRIV3|nr:prismane/CO dehydrogenase family [Trichomonas vaginalis G3]EAX96457.1 hypothetical protein TVAG_024670 [Trichomonas vaginalis G3]KAI5503320.1 prismane/CO dehydrogenase family [Trichomonas vaginalis G3]|eukprot:XP_001309387.1 hypothetical protein [Trichomonas vaginalis G3]